MAGGVIKGMAAGMLVSGLGLAGVSLLLPLPDAGRPADGDLPAEAVPLPPGSEFARDAAEVPPAVPAATPAPAEGTPAAPVAPKQAAPVAPSPATVMQPPPKPETATEPPLSPPPPQTPATALDTPPEAAPAMPVPPPGEAVAPDLPPAAPEPARTPVAPAGEITLMPDGALVPQSPDLPRVIVPGAAAGFASAAGTQVNRLPQVGSAPQGSAVPPSSQPLKPFGKAMPIPADAASVAPEATAAAPADPRPALDRFAAKFAGKPGKPYLSVLLVDVGTAAGGLDQATIAALGPWVTVVLDPAAPEAGKAAEAYRAAGLEVAMLAGPLPAGATAQDVEVALAAWHRAVPQAVALVEPETPVLQGTTRLVSQAEKALAAEGMAYVTQPGGIGAKASAETPRAGIFRVLDSRRDKAAVIGRALGRAGFEADKDGAIVVMLSAWPESVAGLTAWAAEEGAKFNLAPLSALLKTQGAK